MEQSRQMIAFLVVVGGGALVVVAWIWTVVVAARKSAGAALWSLLFWPYALYFSFRHRGRTRIPLLLVGVGAVLIAIPLLKYERSGHPYFLAVLGIGVLALIAGAIPVSSESASQ